MLQLFYFFLAYPENTWNSGKQLKREIVSPILWSTLISYANEICLVPILQSFRTRLWHTVSCYPGTWICITLQTPCEIEIIVEMFIAFLYLLNSCTVVLLIFFKFIIFIVYHLGIIYNSGQYNNILIECMQLSRARISWAVTVIFCSVQEG